MQLPIFYYKHPAVLTRKNKYENEVLPTSTNTDSNDANLTFTNDYFRVILSIPHLLFSYFRRVFAPHQGRN